LFLLAIITVSVKADIPTSNSGITLAALRCEYLVAPDSIASPTPRLSWQLESMRRGAAQTAWQVLVATSAENLTKGKGDLWDSGRQEGNSTNQIVYAGRPLASRTECFWQVRIWDENGIPSAWSASTRWSMGLLRPEDWSAEWISYRDNEPVHTDPQSLHLPAARYYR
jgi:alpha-L-rhamnosidase